jgi:hypothetical protein
VTWKNEYRKGVMKEQTIMIQFIGTVLGVMLLVLISLGDEILIAALSVGGLCSLIAFLISRRSKSDPEE